MHNVSHDPLKGLRQLPHNTVLLARVPKGRLANTQTPLQDLQGLFRITKGLIYERAIFFLEDKDIPYLVWLPASEDGAAKLELSSLPGIAKEMIEYKTLTWNLLLRRTLTPNMTLFANIRSPDGEGTVVENPNKSVRSIDAELESETHGPLLAVGVHEDAQGRRHTHDLGPQDFRHIVDQLRIDYDEKTRLKQNNPAGEKVQGALLHCFRDCIATGHVLKTTNCPASMCLYTSTISLRIAESIGIPLIVKPLPHSLSWRGRAMTLGVNHVLDNISAALLLGFHMDQSWYPHRAALDRQAERYNQQGSWLVVRKDGEPLELKLLAGMVTYLQHIVSTGPMNIGYIPSTYTEDVLARMTAEGFRRWYEGYVPGPGALFNLHEEEEGSVGEDEEEMRLRTCREN
jgi:hypothetical protein